MPSGVSGSACRPASSQPTCRGSRRQSTGLCRAAIRSFDAVMGAAPTWRDAAWLVENTRLPVVLKGVLSVHDAVKAIEIGAAGLIVSNHGGRTLDTLVPSIDALPAIAEAVGGRVPLLLDGAVRRGTDVLKALALGATAVLVGQLTGSASPPPGRSASPTRSSCWWTNSPSPWR